MGESDPKPISAETYKLFGEYLARLSAGEDVQFEELCREHPELAGELRALYGLGGGGAPTATSAPDPVPHEADYLAGAIARMDGRARPYERYRLDEEVGRGGMGVVYRVWDEDLRRTLAMKVILDEHLKSDGHDNPRRTVREGRFLDEAQVNGQLHHPAILPVYEIGLDRAGRLYFTMPLVKGRDLKEIFGLIDEGRSDWTTTRALGVLVQVCDAVAYAHSKNVIHRDLKPSNIMVGKYGEVYAMDWGLARVAGREETRDVRLRRPDPTQTWIETERALAADTDSVSPLVTMDGDVIGTPSYMSPEQAAGAVEEMGPASDIYSMGAILYNLLTGQAPYVAKDARPHAYVILARIQEGAPRPIEELAPDTPAELVAICKKAMRREPADRYKSMSALADDLRAYIEHRVVRAYRTGAIVRASKWVQRNQRIAATAALVLVSAVAGMFWMWRMNSVQAALKDRIETESSFSQAAKELLNRDAEPTLVRASQAGRQWAETLAGRLEAAIASGIQDPFQAAAAHHELGRCLTWLGHPDDALGHLHLARQGYGDPARIMGLSLDLAAAFRALGEDGEADREYAEVTQWLARPESKDHLGAIANLVNRYDREQPFPEAAELTDALRRARGAAFGAGSEAELKSLVDLGAFHARRKNFARAEELFAQVLEVRTATLAADDPKLLLAKVNLATVYIESGKNLDRARALLNEAVGAHEKLSPPRPERALQARNSLAMALLSDEPDNPEVASQALQLALEVNELSEFRDPDFLDTLAKAYYHNGDFVAAFETQDRAIEQLPPDYVPGSEKRMPFLTKLAEYQAAIYAFQPDAPPERAPSR